MSWNKSWRSGQMNTREVLTVTPQEDSVRELIVMVELRRKENKH
jgi:hypothetical protein